MNKWFWSIDLSVLQWRSGVVLGRGPPTSKKIDVCLVPFVRGFDIGHMVQATQNGNFCIRKSLASYTAIQRCTQAKPIK